MNNKKIIMEHRLKVRQQREKIKESQMVLNNIIKINLKLEMNHFHNKKKEISELKKLNDKLVKFDKKLKNLIGSITNNSKEAYDLLKYKRRERDLKSFNDNYTIINNPFNQN